MSTRNPASATVPEEDRLLNADQVAHMLGVSKWWVYHQFGQEVPPVKIGTRSRWEMWRVRAYIDANRVGGAR